MSENQQALTCGVHGRPHCRSSDEIDQARN